MSLDKYYASCGTPKGVPRKRLKARKLRMATAVIRTVRAACVKRDGYCRMSAIRYLMTSCNGASEWAHLGDSKRFKTRGMAADVRHTTAGSLMLCKAHHVAYDLHACAITPVTDRGADGLLTITIGDWTVYV